MSFRKELALSRAGQHVESFARELRRHCARKGSIGQLCKATGINRQQFNKYLAGQMLPGARTMRKICSYLGVSEEHLMSGGQAVTAPPPAAPDLAGFLTGFSAPPTAPSRANPMLQNGFYRACFSVPGHPDLFACWLLHMAIGPGGTQVYSFRNRFLNGAALGFPADRITYRGWVSYSGGEATLMGSTRMPRPLTGIVFVTLQPVAEDDHFSAMALTRRADGLLALSGTIHYLGPECTARRALAGMGIARFDDPGADPVMVKLMRAAPAAATNWMCSVTKKTLQTWPGGSSVPEALAIRHLSV